MATKIQLQTYSQQAYLAIRRMILQGEIAQGSKLTVRMLAEQLGLSPTPIKSALMGLEREGFIVSSAHRGFSVPRAKPGDIADAFELLEVLEVYAAQKIAGSPDREQILTRLDRYLAKAESDGDVDDDRREMAFHRLVWEGAGNARLVQSADNLRGLILIACGGVLDLPDRRGQVDPEHAQILAAIRAGDLDRIAALYRSHFGEMARAVHVRIFPDDSAPTASN